MRIINKELVRTFFKKREINTNKSSYGCAVIIGGSKNYVGAPQFSFNSSNEILTYLGESSLKVGAGTSLLAIPDIVANQLYSSILFSGLVPLSSKDGNIIFVKNEINELISKASSFAIGMGIKDGNSFSIIKYILEKGKQNFVLDADGLLIANKIENYMHRAILTPHPKEMAKIINKEIEFIINNGEEIAQNFAKKHNAIVLLKGTPNTIISDGINTYLNTTGNEKLAKGGSGDVLSGIIAGLLAWQMMPINAAISGAYILGRCAEECSVNPYSCMPTDIIKCIPKIIDELL